MKTLLVALGAMMALIPTRRFTASQPSTRARIHHVELFSYSVRPLPCRIAVRAHAEWVLALDLEQISDFGENGPDVCVVDRHVSSNDW
ncbi:hypothetical protein [Paraburkholderia sp. RL17-373-BIF-A]